MVSFEPTTTPQSERLLADTLGYPKSWHVVRTVKNEGGSQRFVDTIYAGDPKANSDTYYNHLAAMNAAMKWREGQSTPYDNNGGQMLPVDKTIEISVGDEVEVYYDPDGAWYTAVVKKVTHYKDDVRYTVKYKVDRSTQDNICLDKIRFLKAGKRKQKSSQEKEKKTSTMTKTSKSATKKASSSPSPTPNKKRKAGSDAAPKSSKKKKESLEVDYIPDAEGLHLAAEMGLPEGWTANVKPKSRFLFISPDGKKRFTSKKAVFSYLGEVIPANKRKSDKDDETADDDDDDDEVGKGDQIEGDDPPWRTDGHEYLDRRVRYPTPEGESFLGTVTGWISADDKDSAGNPGFVSERDGKPAALFHVTFDLNSTIASQDLEEFELLSCLLEGEG
mmetsp:Transcript_14436/g.27146  ORF Transcript_14436/g.27146 Transcript_14436/m.27146 type:complete len:389 (-) Transcript_14436:146-1312(-)